eukprot:4842578-Amphidinium_carterae.1
MCTIILDASIACHTDFTVNRVQSKPSKAFLASCSRLSYLNRRMSQNCTTRVRLNLGLQR